MTEVYKNSGKPPRMIFRGNTELCKPYIKESRRKLTQHITQTKSNGLDIQVGSTITEYPDGTLIECSNNFNNPVIVIYSSDIQEQENAFTFQCDLYQDDPEFPEDLTKQLKTSIWFDVINAVWKSIPERHGNVDWQGNNGLVTWDGCQNWSRGILNKKAWNDAIYGPNGEDIGWPYNPRPVHASRAGEITTIVDNYPTSNIELTDRSLFSLNFRAVLEPDDDDLFKQDLFINGLKYSPVFDFINQFIMGACIHTISDGSQWCVIVTQNFNPPPNTNVGISFGYEDVWYFKVTDDINPLAIKIHTMYYTSPQEEGYETNKSHITPWSFNKDGTKGYAYRSEQYFLDNLIEWGPYSDPRFIYLDLSYSKEGVTADHTIDTSVIAIASEVNPGGTKLTHDEVILWVNTWLDWMTNLSITLRFPTDRFYGPLDIAYSELDLIGLGTSKKLTITELSGYPTKKIQKDYVIRVAQSSDVIYELKYSGTITTFAHPDGQGGWIEESVLSVANNPVGLFYIGGSTIHNIHFFIELKVDGILSTNTSLTDTGSIVDSSYKIIVQVICLFKNERIEVGSKIEYSIPSTFDDDDSNCTLESSVLSGDENNLETGYTGLGSHYKWSPTESGGTYFTFTGAMSSGNVFVGDLGGSIKCSIDGTHAVISCSYMDIAKYIHPWHRFIWDTNKTTKVNRKDSMNTLGVPQDLQNAWNKYMVNYAIIESDDGVLVKQLSNLLFGKTVKDDPLFTNPITGESEYEFGIEEKDTIAFLPIGLYTEVNNG